jgi:hypothetical protein
MLPGQLRNPNETDAGQIARFPFEGHQDTEVMDFETVPRPPCRASADLQTGCESRPLIRCTLLPRSARGLER